MLVTKLLQKRESRVDLPTPAIPERAIFSVIGTSSSCLNPVRLTGLNPFLAICMCCDGDNGSSSRDRVRLSLIEADDLLFDDLTRVLSGFRSLNSMMSSSSLEFSEVDSHV